MSFFFARQKRKPAIQSKGPSGPRNKVSAKMKQSAVTLNKLGCKVCPLKNAKVDTPNMKPLLPKKTKVYFLGEAPLAKDDEKGKPFRSEAGKLLRDEIPEEYIKYCAFDNIIRNRTPNDRVPDFVEIECCRNNIIADIERAKPQFVVGLGINVLQWALNSGDQQGLRGRMFSMKFGTHTCWFVPIYNPLYVIKNAYQTDKPLNSRYGHCFRMDLKRIFYMIDNYEKPFVTTASEAKEGIKCFDGNDFEELISLLKAARKSGKVALDWETQNLRPYSKDSVVLSGSISFGWNETFAFALNHPNAKWKPKELEIIKKHVKKLLKDPDCLKIAHNVPFEVEWCIFEFGLDSVEHSSWEDTMMQAQFIDERRGEKAGRNDDRRATYQALGFLCRKFFGLNIKDLDNLKKDNMKSEPLDKILPYNGMDARYTYQLHSYQESILEKENLLEAFDEAAPRQPTVAIMQWLGIDVNQKTAKKHQTDLKLKIENIESEINNLKVVKKFVADRGSYNPLSTEDLKVLLLDYLKRDEIIVEPNTPFDRAYDVPSEKKKRDRESNQPSSFKISLDKNVLDKIDHPIANLTVQIRNVTKLKSTYIDEFIIGEGSVIYPDGKLHTSFNTTFAETGRLSSDGPNQQNWPKRQDGWVREIISAPKNHVLLCIDYGQLEWCTTAMCSKDKVIVDATWDGYDVHMEWAQKIAYRYPHAVGGKKFIKDNDVMKKFRGLVKNKMVFPCIFGATNTSVAAYLSMPQDVVDDIMEEFWDTFSGLRRWQDGLMKNYYKDGYVASPTGRRRHYPLTRNQAINHPIQSVACDIVCDAMCRLSMMAHETGNYYLHPILNIHDDLTFAVPNDDKIIADCLEEITKVMLTPPYDFINVPMSVEASMGENWLEAIGKDGEIGKFWSIDL